MNSADLVILLGEIEALDDPSMIDQIVNLAQRAAGSFLREADRIVATVERTMLETASALANCPQPAPSSMMTAAAHDDEENGPVVEALAPNMKIFALKLVALWYLIERLCKEHDIFVEVFRSRLVMLASKSASLAAIADASVAESFAMILNAFRVHYGTSMASLLQMKANPTPIQQTAAPPPATSVPAAVEAVDKPTKSMSLSAAVAAAGLMSSSSAAADSDAEGPSRALIAHSSQLRSVGAFVTKQGQVQRTGAEKHALSVRTADSAMAMAMASAYAPARPVEISVAVADRDQDAPVGFVQAVPAAYSAEYEAQRRKRLRDVMERNRIEDEKKARDRLLDGSSRVKVGTVAAMDFSDIVMPEEFPRDEYGVMIGNSPLGVRFLREAIRSCGGAVELDVIVQRLATLANKDFAAEFGDVREFVRIHRPTFRVTMENNVWIVRLAPTAYPKGRVPEHFVTDENLTPTETSCPNCMQQIKSRNLGRHMNCRRCVTTQMALGAKGIVRSPIAELAAASVFVIEHYKSDLDDDDILWFAGCLDKAALIPRYRLSSSRKFAPVLKAIRCLRDRWLLQKAAALGGSHVPPPNAHYTTSVTMSTIALDSGDAAMVHLFNVVGSNVYRLPLAWIETGDVIDMAKRYCTGVRPAHNPPPRPADPRISLYNEYPGMLLCESEIDDEDEPSEDEAAYSDDEGETFEYAPPVTLVDTLTIAGFERDTKRLNYKLRTAPPLVHTRVLRAGGNQTHSQMYGAPHQQSN